MPRTMPNNQTTTATETKANETEKTQPDFSTACSRMIMVTKPATAKPKKGILSRHECEAGRDAENAPKRGTAGKVGCDGLVRRLQQQHNARAHDDQGGDKRKQAAVRTGRADNAERPRIGSRGRP